MAPPTVLLWKILYTVHTVHYTIWEEATRFFETQIFLAFDMDHWFLDSHIYIKKKKWIFFRHVLSGWNEKKIDTAPLSQDLYSTVQYTEEKNCQ